MNITAVMVVRDEANRFLQSSLEWNSRFVDRILVLDDGSKDASVEIAKQYTPYVYERPASCPSFLENESMFRQYCWDVAGEVVQPEEWYFIIDADEYLVTDNLPLHLEPNMHAVEFKKYEFWECAADGYYYRVDGYWGDIRNVRLCRYHRYAHYADRKMGCTSLPQMYQTNISRLDPDAACIVHAGYLVEKDRREKYDRYRHYSEGHNKSHIESIVGTPKLAKWDRPSLVPHIWRGIR